MKSGKTAKLHKVARNQKTWRKSFFNNHLSPNFKNFQDMLDYTPEVHRMSGKNRAHEAHEIGSYNPRTKLMEKLLKPFYWNHSKCSKSSLEKQGMATFRSFSCNFVRSKCHLKSAHESARNWDSWNCPNSWKSGSGAVLFFSKFQRLDAVQKKMLRPKKRWEENSCWSRAAIFSCAGGKSSKSIRDGNPEQTEQTSKSVCLPAVAANCSLRLATRCHSKDSNAKLNQSNLTPGWPNTWGTRAQCLCPQTWLNALWCTLSQHCGYWSHMWKKTISAKTC